MQDVIEWSINWTGTPLQRIPRRICSSRTIFCVIPFEELRSAAGILQIPEKTVNDCFRSEISKFESHDGYDFITLNIPDDSDQRRLPHRVCIYFTDRVLLIVSDGYDLIDGLIKELRGESIKNVSLGRIIALFFDKLTSDDSIVLEKMEQDISDLEEDVMVAEKKELLDDLVAFRKRLRALKRYYEQLLEIAEAIEQNENGLLDKKRASFFSNSIRDV